MKRKKRRSTLTFNHPETSPYIRDLRFIQDLTEIAQSHHVMIYPLEKGYSGPRIEFMENGTSHIYPKLFDDAISLAYEIGRILDRQSDPEGYDQRALRSQLTDAWIYAIFLLDQVDYIWHRGEFLIKDLEFHLYSHLPKEESMDVAQEVFAHLPQELKQTAEDYVRGITKKRKYFHDLLDLPIDITYELPESW